MKPAHYGPALPADLLSPLLLVSAPPFFLAVFGLVKWPPLSLNSTASVYYVKSHIAPPQGVFTAGVLLLRAFSGMIKMKKLCSLAPNHLPPLSVLIDDLHGPRTPEAIGHHLGVSALTVRRWIAKDEAPRAAALALFWETRWGLSALDAQAVNLVRLHVGLNNALRRENATLVARVAYLESVGQFGSANGPLWADLPAVDQLRQV